jgi:hypothetical protein
MDCGFRRRTQRRNQPSTSSGASCVRTADPRSRVRGSRGRARTPAVRLRHSLTGQRVCLGEPATWVRRRGRSRNSSSAPRLSDSRIVRLVRRRSVGLRRCSFIEDEPGPMRRGTQIMGLVRSVEHPALDVLARHGIASAWIRPLSLGLGCNSRTTGSNSRFGPDFQPFVINRMELVDQTFKSWNRLSRWLSPLDVLRRAGSRLVDQRCAPRRRRILEIGAHIEWLLRTALHRRRAGRPLDGGSDRLGQPPCQPEIDTLQVPSPDRKDGDPPTLESKQGSNGNAAGPPPGPPNHDPLAFSSIAASRITP